MENENDMRSLFIDSELLCNLENIFNSTRSTPLNYNLLTVCHNICCNSGNYKLLGKNINNFLKDLEEI